VHRSQMSYCRRAADGKMPRARHGTGASMPLLPPFLSRRRADAAMMSAMPCAYALSRLYDALPIDAFTRRRRKDAALTRAFPAHAMPALAPRLMLRYGFSR